MAARSMAATFTNQTSATLTLQSAVIQHGEWDQEPPQTIGPNSNAAWSSESAGFLTGTAGQVVYQLSGGVVETTFDVPFKGDNSATASAPPAYRIVANITQGDNAIATYTLTGGS